MKYGFMQKLMWAAYKGTFRKQLAETLREDEPKIVMKSAHKKYKEILADVDEFEKGDGFLINILSCAMLSAVLLSVKNKHTVEEVRVYYRKAICENFLTKAVSKSSKYYTEKGREKLKERAKKSESNINPYSWRFIVEDGETLNQYTATFYTCGICYLMTKLGLQEYVPSMCTLDYDMAAMNNTVFTREYTLAGGGKYCDCHYDHKGGGKTVQEKPNR